MKLIAIRHDHKLQTSDLPLHPGEGFFIVALLIALAGATALATTGAIAAAKSAGVSTLRAA